MFEGNSETLQALRSGFLIIMKLWRDKVVSIESILYCIIMYIHSSSSRSQLDCGVTDYLPTRGGRWAAASESEGASELELASPLWEKHTNTNRQYICNEYRATVNML